MRLMLTCLMVITVSPLFAQKTDSLPPGVYHWDSLVTTVEESRARKQVMEGSTTSLVHFEVHATSIQPGKAPHPPHTHADEEELIIVKEGQVKITINGVSNTLGPGSVAYAIPLEEHGIVNTGNTQATYYILKYKSRLPMELERAKKNGGSFMINWDTVTVKKTDKGQRREFVNKPTSQLLKFEMHTTALNEGLDSHAPHTHKEEEIILILKGNVIMHVGDKTYSAGPGDIVFLPSMILHNLVNTGKGQCEYFAFQWR
ncbi:MAG: cupin domain-containing protein [Bacteroidetes bacterium]|nr:MAG: cupin domain-containing protein [Bacteroidota bacterium]